jgi:hypothetical protein
MINKRTEQKMAKELATFWDKTHPLSAQNDKLFKTLVPSSGACKTLQGELLRASCKISYDWFNNGWGCNNWSGAVLFLNQYFKELPVQPTAAKLAAFNKSLNRVYDFSHGERVKGRITDRSAEKHVTKIHEIVVETLLANKDAIANSVDMWDLKERG